MTQPFEHHSDEYNEVLNSLSVHSDFIFCNRLTNPTMEQARFSTEHALWMAKENNVRKYLMDARGTLPPNAELRRALRDFISSFIGNIEAMAIVIDQHSNTRVRTQFIFHNHDLLQNMRLHICTTIEEGREFLSQY